MHTLSAEALDNLVRDILLAAGADERNADRVSGWDGGDGLSLMPLQSGTKHARY